MYQTVTGDPRHRKSNTKIKAEPKNTLSLAIKSKKQKKIYLVFSKTRNGFSIHFVYHRVTGDSKY